MAYTGILKTSLAGCGLTDHVQLTLAGILENLTIMGEIRTVEKCILGDTDINGTTYDVIMPTITLTFAKPGVSQEASCYVLCSKQ